MKKIKEIIKQKGLDNLSEFKKMIYIFVHSNILNIIDCEKRTGTITKVVEIMERKKMKLYNEYHIALERKQYVKEQIEKGINRGIKQGIELGIERGIHMEREQKNA